MVDIDYFKKINDTYGHMQADKLLIQLGKILQKNVRKSDIAARFGGEEFMLLLTETPLEKAKEIANRIKQDIKKDNLLKSIIYFSNALEIITIPDYPKDYANAQDSLGNTYKKL